MAEDNKKEADSASEAKSHKESHEDIDSVKGVSAIAYLGILFFVPIITNPKSKYAMFHANQGLLLLIASIALQIATWILAVVSLGLLFFLPFLAWIAILVLFILGLVNALNGKMERLPIIGKWDIVKPQK